MRPTQQSCDGQGEEVIEASPKAIHQTVSKLPKDFPGGIAASIVNGVKERVAQLARERSSAGMRPI